MAGKFAPGSLQLADPALSSLAALQAKRDEENAELNRMAKGETPAAGSVPAKPETPARKKAPKKAQAEDKTEKMKKPETAAVPPTKKTSLIEKPVPQETKRATLCMRIKQSELDAWQQAAKENGVSLTYLVEYVMGKYLSENA